MREATDALVLDLVEWIAREPRLYSDVIDTWRTSCPRLTIWEDAVDRGYVAVVMSNYGDAGQPVVDKIRSLVRARTTPTAQ